MYKRVLQTLIQLLKFMQIRSCTVKHSTTWAAMVIVKQVAKWLCCTINYFKTMREKMKKNIFYTAFICLIFSCSSGKEIDNTAVEKLAEYEKIKDILLKNKEHLTPQKDARDTNALMFSDFKNFKNVIVPKNPKLKDEMEAITLIWGNLGKLANTVSFDKNNTIFFDTGFYNGGITDSTQSRGRIVNHSSKTY